MVQVLTTFSARSIRARGWGLGLRRAAWAAGVLAAGVAAGCAPSGEAESDTQEVSEETLAALAEAGQAQGEVEEEVIFDALEVPSDALIDGTRIGPVRPGDTLGRLQSALGSAPVRFAPDYTEEESAVCVDESDGEELYCALIERVAQPGPDTVIEAVVTRHPRYRTLAGVGPGIDLAAAEAVYGEAVLSLDPADSSIEYVDFDEGPPGSISFRPLAPGAADGRAGIYPAGAAAQSPTGIVETEDYVRGALIGAVEVRRSRRR